MKKSIKFLFLATIILVAAVSISVSTGTASAQVATQPVNCPPGFICVPVTPPSTGGGGGIGTTTPVGNCYVFTTNLSIGSTGVDVVALQTTLLTLGYDIPDISSGRTAKGYFGSSTAAALIKYQTANGIPGTGFFGPLTRAKINASCSNPLPVTGSRIVASLDPSSPQSSTIQISPTSQTQNVVLAVIDLKSQGQSATLQSLTIGIMVNEGSSISKIFSNVKIRAQGLTYSGSFVDDNKGNIRFNNLTIPLPANTEVPITVLGTVLPGTNNALDGSSAQAWLPLPAIQAIDANYNSIPVPTEGSILGNTITFNGSGVQVSNTSATLGTQTCNSTSNPTECDYPVSFTFSLTAGNSPMYVAKTGSCSPGYACLANPLQFSGDIAQIIIQSASVTPSTGDGSNYYYIAPGQTRQFTYSGVITNSNNYLSASTYTVQVSGISYGTSASNQSSNSITSGLGNLKMTVSFNGGGAVITTPSITLIYPKDGYTWYIEDQNFEFDWSTSNFGSSVIYVYLQTSDGKYIPIYTVGQGVPNTGSYILPKLVPATGSVISTFSPGIYKAVVCGQFGNGTAGSPANSVCSNTATITISSRTSTTQPSITVLSPNGGENWVIGSTHPISWSSSGIALNYNVQIGLIDTRYSTEIGPRGEAIIAQSITNAGDYLWTIPQSVGSMDLRDTSQAVYKIVIHSASDAYTGVALADRSNSPFSITASPTVTACPVGYICNVIGQPGYCPTGYICTSVTFNCPPGSSCSTMSPVQAVTVQPTINLTSTPSSLQVAKGAYGSATVSWTTTGATSCTSSAVGLDMKAPAAWQTPALSGSASFNLDANTTLTLVCTGPGGSANKNIMIGVTSNTPSPTTGTVSLTADSNVSSSRTHTLNLGFFDDAYFYWKVSNPTGCSFSSANASVQADLIGYYKLNTLIQTYPEWTQEGRISLSGAIDPGSSAQITLSCPYGSDSVTINRSNDPTSRTTTMINNAAVGDAVRDAVIEYWKSIGQ